CPVFAAAVTPAGLRPSAGPSRLAMDESALDRQSSDVLDKSPERLLGRQGCEMRLPHRRPVPPSFPTEDPTQSGACLGFSPALAVQETNVPPPVTHGALPLPDHWS